MKRLAVAVVLAGFSASATDLKTCNPITDEACRAAHAQGADAWKAAHPHERLAEGTHTVLRVERMEDFCRQQAFERIDNTSLVPNYEQAREGINDCFREHHGRGVWLNSFGEPVGDVP